MEEFWVSVTFWKLHPQRVMEPNPKNINLQHYILYMKQMIVMRTLTRSPAKKGEILKVKNWLINKNKEKNKEIKW